MPGKNPHFLEGKVIPESFRFFREKGPLNRAILFPVNRKERKYLDISCMIDGWMERPIIPFILGKRWKEKRYMNMKRLEDEEAIACT